HAVNWQVKEKVDGQEFKVKLDLKKVVAIAREVNYRGYLPIETLSKKTGEPDYDPKARAAQLLKELREAIKQAEAGACVPAGFRSASAARAGSGPRSLA